MESKENLKKAGLGEVISYKEMDSRFPRRSAFVDKTIEKEVDGKINKGELLFFPNSIYDHRHMQQTKYAKAKYKIIMFGIVEDGRPVCVIINDISPYFEVKIPNDRVEDRIAFAETLVQQINMTKEDHPRYAEALRAMGKKPSKEEYFKIEPTDFEIIRAKPLRYYQDEPSYYVRIYFNKSSHRVDAIKYLRSQGHETAHDDLNNYHRVVCRDYRISYASWLELSDINAQDNNLYIKGIVIHVSIKNIKLHDLGEYSKKGIQVPKHILKDNTMVMTWDIETYNPIDNGVPHRKVPQHKCYMICMTFQWVHATEQLLRVCLVDKPCSPHPEFLTVICSSEKELFKAFAKCYSFIWPEIILGFNDAGYDWPWIIERAEVHANLLAYIGEKFDRTKQSDRTDKKTMYNYKSFSVKIEADVNANGSNLQMPGYIPIDVMIEFRRLYPTSEKWGLNFFLSKNKISPKEDLSYKEQRRIYMELTKCEEEKREFPSELTEGTALIGKYCVVDAQKCHELMKIRNVVQDRREVANISYTSLYDAFYFANGMKVRNLVIARAQLQNMTLSNIRNNDAEMGKYPGAWVFPPKKGLVTSKLSIRERIVKARMGYDEYAEWLEKTDDEIKEDLILIRNFYQNGGDVTNTEVLKKCCPSLCKFLEEKTGRPITGLDFSSLYPSLIMAYNLSPEYIVLDKKYAKELDARVDKDGNKIHHLHRIEFLFNGRKIRGWSIRHDNKLDPTKPDYKFGLFGAILKELFDSRKKLKKGAKGLEYWEHHKEELLALPTEEFNSPERQQEYEDVCFHYNALDSKQKALKVFMNTFYGEAGNRHSPLFMLQVAGGITSAGQYNIKKAYEYVESKGCKVYYGDSVAEDTVVLIRTESGNIGIVRISEIESISKEKELWFEYPQFKPGDIGIDKEQHFPRNLETWTASGWKKIVRVIRHKTNKKMYRVCTPQGIVDVTEDHSLLTPNRELIKPDEIKVGSPLLQGFPDEYEVPIPHYDEHVFFKAWHRGDSNNNMIDNKYLNMEIEDREKYLGAYLCVLGNPTKTIPMNNRAVYYETRGSLTAQRLFYLMKSVGCKNITIDVDETDLYTITYWPGEENEDLNQVTKIIELPKTSYDMYVYDLETEDGSFQAGVGSIIVKNTDSIYESMPEACFAQVDLDYYTEKISKLEYWEQMVNITFTEIKKLNEEVNQMFREDNGTDFLKMAFEESLFPVLFTAKKKYVGLPHISRANFDPKVPLFIRGLELKKRGVSTFLKTICEDILKKCVSVDNVLTVLELVQNKIREVYTSNWDDHFNDFIMTAVYRPDKINVKVRRFVERMREERDVEITPGERINYVVTKRAPFIHDIRGRKIKLKIGDMMEIADIAQKECLEIDMDYYMQKSINGQLARFITYHDEFHVDVKDYTDNIEVKKAEDTILKKARKYIDNYCKSYYTQYEDQGSKYKQVFKQISSIVSNVMNQRYGNMQIMQLLNKSIGIKGSLEEWLKKHITNLVHKKKENINYSKSYVDDRLKGLKGRERTETVHKLQELYYGKTGMIKKCEEFYQERSAVLEAHMRKSWVNVRRLFDINNEIVGALVKESKDSEFDAAYLTFMTQEVIIEYDKEIKEALVNLEYIYVNMIGNYEYIYRIRGIVSYLKEFRTILVRPTVNINLEQAVSSVAAEFLIESL